MRTLFCLGMLVSFFAVNLHAQTDSAKVAQAFQVLLDACPTDKAEAASLIVYRGEKEKRKWKDVCDYSKAEDKERVDDVCANLSEVPANYMITEYQTEKESEGTWYVLGITFEENGEQQRGYVAFLKIDDQFALGDID